METKSKEVILETLSRMTVDQIDKYRDEKLLEYKGILAEYYTAKDDELKTRHDKRKAFLDEGNSLSRAEQLLRADEELYKKKRVMIGLQALRKKLELERDILSIYFWRARNN